MIGKGAENISKIYLGSNAVSKIYLGNELVFGGQPSIPNYLRFVALEASTIGLTSKQATFPNLEYSLDGSTWTTWDGTSVALNSGATMYVKGNNPNGLCGAMSRTNTFTMSGSIEAHGNIMSLLYGDNFDGQLVLPSNYCFARLFENCSALLTPPELPATTLTSACYTYLFRHCTSLRSAPILPALTMTLQCYGNMFSHCSSLTTPPELPATTLAERCYAGMFTYTAITEMPKLDVTTLAQGCYGAIIGHCENITHVELPAMTLVNTCYTQLMDGCTNINYIKALFTTTPGTQTRYWVRGVAASGIFVKHINATWDVSGNNGVPSGWTVIYYNPDTDKYYLSDKTTECDDHGNVV